MSRAAARAWWWAAAVVAVVVAAVWIARPSRESPLEPAPSDRGAERAAAPPGDRRPAIGPTARYARSAAPPEYPAPEAPGRDGDRLAGPWDLVDLDGARAAMPNNLYWRLAAPTDDPRVLQERDDERARRNVEYGKVLSGTATEGEIHAYYAHRRQLSSDYVEFVTYVLDRHRGDLPERDVGLLELARRLHLARLEEIPRRIADALERQQAQDAARKAWLAQPRSPQ